MKLQTPVYDLGKKTLPALVPPGKSLTMKPHVSVDMLQSHIQITIYVQTFSTAEDDDDDATVLKAGI